MKRKKLPTTNGKTGRVVNVGISQMACGEDPKANRAATN